MILQAFDERIAACRGGSLRFPSPLTFLSGPFNLSSNSSYVIEVGSTIKALPGPTDWPVVAGLPSYAPDYWRFQPFVWAYEQQNVSITGGGAIDGSGGTYWWPAWFNGSLPDPLVMHRPYLFEMYNCSDVSVVDLTFRDSPFWTVHPYLSSIGVRVYCRSQHLLAHQILTASTRIVAPMSLLQTRRSQTVRRRLHIPSPINLCDFILPLQAMTASRIKSGRGPPGAAFGQASHHITVTNPTLLSGLGGELRGLTMPFGSVVLPVSRGLLQSRLGPRQRAGFTTY